MRETRIEPIRQPLYGDILNELIRNDNNFKNKFEEELNKFIKESNI